MSHMMCHMTQEENEKLKQAMQAGGVQMQPTTGMSPEGQSWNIIMELAIVRCQLEE